MRHNLRLLSLVLIVVFIFSFTGCVPHRLPNRAAEANSPETTAQPIQENVEYNIGDTGPAGGFIFYVNPNYEADGWRYLEASLNDQSPNIQWFNGTYVEAEATATAVGTGKVNTQKILSVQGNGSYAAELCNNFIINGFNDWFLPSKDELNAMYVSLGLKGLAVFATSGFYWSSSEYDERNAWYQDFDNGYQSQIEKRCYGFRVRAARAF